MSNIEEDIKFIDEMIKEYNTFGDLDNPDYEDTDRIYKTIEHILAERKQDKTRIKELEEQVKNEIKGRDILAKLNEDSIPKQKVKDILQNNRNELFSITYVEPIQYKPFEMQIERINKIEKELLESK